MFKYLDKFSLRTRMFAGGAALLLIGGLVGGAIASGNRRVPAMVPASPMPIASASAPTGSAFAEPVATVRGVVTAVYGSSFTLKDPSGQALVHTGQGKHESWLIALPPLVAAGQTVTVQGRFDQGVIRARFIVTADGRAWAMMNHRGRHGGKRHYGHGSEPKPQAAATVPAPTPK